MKEFLKKPPIKSAIIAVLTTITSITMAFLDDFNVEQNKFVLKLSIFIITVGVYVFVLIFYTTNEVNDRRSIDFLEAQVETFENLVTNFISICQLNSSDVNTCIKRIKSDNIIDLNIWNFDKACQSVCAHIYDSVCKLGGSKNYGVSYVKLMESKGSEHIVVLSAYANQASQKPSIFGEERSFDIDENNDAYHDLELFKKNSSDTDVLIGKEIIDGVFAHQNKEKRNQNKGKYNQYIGIPIICDNTKMVGLLEIVCLKDATLGINEDEVREIANKFFVPYANIILLLHKIEKVLLAGSEE